MSLNPLLIGAQCELNTQNLSVPRLGLNPLLIGAQCELCRTDVLPHPDGLNPLLIGAQCELDTWVLPAPGKVSIPF